MTSIDLKEAYLHVPVPPPHRSTSASLGEGITTSSGPLTRIGPENVHESALVASLRVSKYIPIWTTFLSGLP